MFIVTTWPVTIRPKGIIQNDEAFSHARMHVLLLVPVPWTVGTRTTHVPEHATSAATLYYSYAIYQF
jgi:hypothetical protein